MVIRFNIIVNNILEFVKVKRKIEKIEKKIKKWKEIKGEISNLNENNEEKIKIEELEKKLEEFKENLLYIKVLFINFKFFTRIVSFFQKINHIFLYSQVMAL